MQSARQKKKFTQQKKRHHDHIKAKGSTAGDTAKKSGSKDQQTQSGNKKVKARENRLGSNWDRYEELKTEATHQDLHYQENEEQLQQRLVQLLNLPIHQAVPPHHMTSHPYSSDTDPSPSSFLSLDCASLAVSLADIPLHQQLGISPELVELCKMNAQPESASGPNILEVDLSVCARKKYTFEFKPTESPLHAPSTSEANPLESPSTADHVHGVTKRGKVPGKDASDRSKIIAGVSVSPLRIQQQGSQEDDDDVLDKLLERGGAGGGGVTVTHTGTMPTSSSTDTNIPPTNEDTCTVNVAELDDMLDELLS